jgi:1-aminocyclopropane-1-carboxylate deaminase
MLPNFMNELLETFDRSCRFSEVQDLQFPEFSNNEIRVSIKRDDLIHPFISGNKWRKLKYFLDDYQKTSAKSISTYGGAYSNHLLATACAGATFGIKTKGYVRGDELNAHSNHILKLADQFGMDLDFISRSDYKIMKHSHGLQGNHSYHIPEGGAGALGRKGCADIINELDLEYDYILLDVGTGTTYAGILQAIQNKNLSTEVHGVVVLKNAEYLDSEICDVVEDKDGVSLLHQYHYGGFGRWDSEQMKFNKWFSSQTGILVDPVYTGKLFRALFELINNSFFAEGSSVLCLHTGGMTGVLSNDFLAI